MSMLGSQVSSGFEAMDSDAEGAGPVPPEGVHDSNPMRTAWTPAASTQPAEAICCSSLSSLGACAEPSSGGYSQRSTPQSSVLLSSHPDLSARSSAVGAPSVATADRRLPSGGIGGAAAFRASQPPVAAVGARDRGAYDADGFLLDSAQPSRQVVQYGLPITERNECEQVADQSTSSDSTALTTGPA